VSSFLRLINCVCVVGGKKIIISVPNGMTETEVNKVMVVTRAYLQQYVYVEMVLAECFMQKIEKSILKKKNAKKVFF
jgi:hypothetical protein